MNLALVEYVERIASRDHDWLISERKRLIEDARGQSSKSDKRPLQLRRRIVQALLARNTRGLR